jgi:hypothetical protein
MITSHWSIFRPEVSYKKIDITIFKFLQQFHLAIKYKKGSTNNLKYIPSRRPTSNISTLGTLMHMDPFTHDAYKHAYIENEDFKEVFQQLQV